VTGYICSEWTVIENTKSLPKIFMATEKEKCNEVTLLRFYSYPKNI
jgi:hypothetical protein